jgi:hypothetical protein
LHSHPRITAGIELILDRALDAGGWNYGNKSVFGTELRPQPGPTGLALLALASSGVESRAVSAALAYLLQTLRDLRAPVSLGWGILGLRAHHACPMEAETWLARSYTRSIGKPDASMGLALLLLASSERTLDLVIAPAWKRTGRCHLQTKSKIKRKITIRKRIKSRIKIRSRTSC